MQLESEKVIFEEVTKIKINWLYLFVKRMTDVVFSFFGLIVLSPLFLILSICIKLEDPKGRVFFKQVRVGKNGKVFRIIKFRSMCVDAEKQLNNLLKHNEVEGAMFKMKKDPRITRVGAFIRKTSIDELPQLMNVLLGEMSLVGPRPPLQREVEEYTLYDKQRLNVKPGCTGLWQLNGRNDVHFEDMVEMDLEYIKKCNWFLDMKIIIKTPIVMFKDRTGC